VYLCKTFSHDFLLPNGGSTPSAEVVEIAGTRVVLSGFSVTLASLKENQDPGGVTFALIPSVSFQSMDSSNTTVLSVPATVFLSGSGNIGGGVAQPLIKIPGRGVLLDDGLRVNPVFPFAPGVSGEYSMVVNLVYST